ncbi:hypothetical protein [Massilia putida]|uniref:hypothetical protein n=1 Tax=Massilia putida TaxID=1141883 RepID=UPI0012EC331B|nr:hypothetical protein [Massilia putida]
MRFKHLIVTAVLGLTVTPAFADVCVWRDPEQTMTKIFPEAKDYRTVDVRLTPALQARIETAIARKLTPGEADSWTYYSLVGAGGKPVGIVLADAEKGEYGVIEMVMGIDLSGKIRQLYIQRSRERKAKELASPAFLHQFDGKNAADTFEIGRTVTPVDGADLASREIAFGVKKMLTFHHELSNTTKEQKK